MATIKLRVILSPQAKNDYDEAGDYYEQSQAGLGSDFAAKVRKVLNRIGKMPEIHQVVFLDIRRALLEKYPYNVYYRIEPDRVYVIAIVHRKRDPGVWQGRA